MIIGTIGHVDHGKSTLVRWLSGTDPDRWEEERRRGRSIGLGFAFAGLGDGTTLSIVDVPGHVRFAPTMLAGAHAVDVALLAVSAAEGWMAQTEQHVGILGQLDTRSGVVALTHVDRADPQHRRAIECDLRARLQGTFMHDAEIIHVDGTTGRGVDRLQAALIRALDDCWAGDVDDHGRPRMWIDRSFSLAGVGRVVTGTLTGGELALGDRVEVLHRDRTLRAMVRSIHVDGEPAQRACARHRVALHLSDDDAVMRPGAAVVAPGQWQVGSHLHVALGALRGRSRVPARGGYELVLGTGRWEVQLRRLESGPQSDSAQVEGIQVEGAQIEGIQVEGPQIEGPQIEGPQIEGPQIEIVRLHARYQVGPVAPGDRFVLLDTGVGSCVAGGVVLSVDARVIRRRVDDLAARFHALSGQASSRTQRLSGCLLEENDGALRADELQRIIGSIKEVAGDEPVVIHGGWACAGAAVAGQRSALVDRLRGSEGIVGVDVPARPEARAAAAQLVENAGAVARDGLLWPSADALRDALDVLDRHILNVAGERMWPRLELSRACGIGGRELGDRVRSGLLVALGGDRLMSAEAYGAHCARVCERLSAGPASLGEIRDLLTLSRNATLLLLESMDREGLTRRWGSRRVLVGDGSTGGELSGGELSGGDAQAGADQSRCP